MSDCPENVVFYLKSNGYLYDSFEYSLTRPIYPYGQCCKVQMSERSRESLVFKMLIKVPMDNLKTYKLLLSDKETSSRFRLHRFSIKGVELKTSDREGLNKYMIKLHQGKPT